MTTGGIDLEQLEVARLFLFGDVKFLHLLLLLMIIDILTGWAKAFVNKNLWSRKSLFGFARKMLILSVIIVANIVDQILDLNGLVATATLLFYVANEGLSIVENLTQVGVPIPKVITDKLYLLNEKSEEFKDEVKDELLGKHVDSDLKDDKNNVRKDV